MNVEELVRTIEQSGGTLAITENGNRLRYRLPVEAGSLIDELRRLKPEIIPFLRRRSFVHLAPFLGKRVWTPDGPGKLVKLADCATVEFKGSAKTTWYDSTAVIPYA